MATNLHGYFHCISNWSNSARLTFSNLNLSCGFRLRGLDAVFAAEPFVNKVLTCARVDYRIGRNVAFRAVYAYLDHDMVVFVVQCFHIVQCCVKVHHLNALWFGPVPQTMVY